MTALSFVDTNILVYARDPRDERKRQLADARITDLWRARTGRISMQVVSEYYATTTRKISPSLEPDVAWGHVLTLMAWNPRPIDRDLLEAAREIERRYRTSWWDATIVAAAQAQRCTILLSDDFQDGMAFGELVVRNPFATEVQEPAAAYRAETPQPLPRHRPRGRPAKSA